MSRVDSYGLFTQPTRTRQQSSKLGRDETKLSCLVASAV